MVRERKIDTAYLLAMNPNDHLCKLEPCALSPGCYENFCQPTIDI